MNEYELMIVLHPRFNAEEAEQALAAIQAHIAGEGAELLSTDVWGRRRLAYPIAGVLEGTYVLQTMRLAPDRAAAVEAWLRIQESILRHLLIRGIIPFQGHRREDDRYRERDREPRDEDRDEEREAAVAVASGRDEDADTSDDDE